MGRSWILLVHSPPPTSAAGTGTGASLTVPSAFIVAPRALCFGEGVGL
jgi:hypothetical protein